MGIITMTTVNSNCGIKFIFLQVLTYASCAFSSSSPSSGNGLFSKYGNRFAFYRINSHPFGSVEVIFQLALLNILTKPWKITLPIFITVKKHLHYHSSAIIYQRGIRNFIYRRNTEFFCQINFAVVSADRKRLLRIL